MNSGVTPVGREGDLAQGGSGRKMDAVGGGHKRRAVADEGVDGEEGWRSGAEGAHRGSLRRFFELRAHRAERSCAEKF